MIICESNFEMRDSKNPNLSMTEIDYYAWIPAGSDLPNHRLSLRKNLRTGEYEVYRRFYETKLTSRKQLTVIKGEDTGKEEVTVHSKNLAEAIKFACNEYRKYHGDRLDDQVCQHRYPVKSRWCEVKA